PLPTDASPTALLPGNIDNSNPEEDPEEDHVDYPANGGDNDDNESSDDDDDNDDVEKDGEDDEEEEYLASVDPSVVPIDDPRIDTSDETMMEDASNQEKMIDDLDRDAGVALMDDKKKEKKAEEAKVAGDDQV
nr:hypothetical protein [Tanacetum cinerariifolium]